MRPRGTYIADKICFVSGEDLVEFVAARLLLLVLDPVEPGEEPDMPNYPNLEIMEFESKMMKCFIMQAERRVVDHLRLEYGIRLAPCG